MIEPMQEGIEKAAFSNGEILSAKNGKLLYSSQKYKKCEYIFDGGYQGNCQGICKKIKIMISQKYRRCRQSRSVKYLEAKEEKQ